MKLKKLIIFEILAVAAILVAIMIVIENAPIPYLEASQPASLVSMYQEMEYDRGIITLGAGESAKTYFNYSTYDPAILVLEMSFQSWQSEGNLTLSCNKERFASINATADKPNASLVMVSVSGVNWVQTTLSGSGSPASVIKYGNEITFASGSPNGYSGTFDYRIVVRGSR